MLSGMSQWVPATYQPIERAGRAALPGAAGFVARLPGDTWHQPVAAGAFAPGGWLRFDAFNDSDLVLQLRLQMREDERKPEPAAGGSADGNYDTGGLDGGFTYTFSLLPRCQARVRLPMGALSLNRWMLAREGALLKPMCGGEAVRPEEVRGLTFSVWSMGVDPQPFCITPPTFTATEPPALADPLCPPGVLMDEVGQATTRDWPGKSRGVGEVVDRLRRQRDAAEPLTSEFEHNGFFRTEHDGRRWWLIDPLGRPFFSNGPDCVRPDGHADVALLAGQCARLPDRVGEFADCWKGGHFSPLVANHRRAFGDGWREDWGRLSLDFLRRGGFNTVGNWSDLGPARAASFPHVTPMHGDIAPGIPAVFRDFPDVFHPDFPDAAGRWASQLAAHADDPALIGYFMMNEPTWGFAAQTPAEGMLRNADTAHTRDELARRLREKHGDDAALAKAWDTPDLTFAAVASGPWRGPISSAARDALADFAAEMIARLFGTLAAACRRADPNHLNLGVRFAHVPAGPAGDRLLGGLSDIDVFSYNSYTVGPQNRMGEVAERLGVPALVGEWHFGAGDVGLPAGALSTVATQRDRGLAYRHYLEAHAAQPWCVGCHWFTLYDQSCLGRNDGEPYNCGLIDVCGRPYGELVSAAAETHARLPAILRGEIEPVPNTAEHQRRLSV